MYVLKGYGVYQEASLVPPFVDIFVFVDKILINTIA